MADRSYRTVYFQTLQTLHKFISDQQKDDFQAKGGDMLDINTNVNKPVLYLQYIHFQLETVPSMIIYNGMYTLCLLVN